MRGGPGLRSVKDMPVLQDGPPPGGFPSVRYGRRIPNTGPTGAAIFGVSALVISYGFYKVRLRRDQRAAVALCALPAEARGLGLRSGAPLRLRPPAANARPRAAPRRLQVGQGNLKRRCVGASAARNARCVVRRVSSR